MYISTMTQLVEIEPEVFDTRKVKVAYYNQLHVGHLFVYKHDNGRHGFSSHSLENDHGILTEEQSKELAEFLARDYNKNDFEVIEGEGYE